MKHLYLNILLVLVSVASAAQTNPNLLKGKWESISMHITSGNKLNKIAETHDFVAERTYDFISSTTCIVHDAAKDVPTRYTYHLAKDLLVLKIDPQQYVNISEDEREMYTEPIQEYYFRLNANKKRLTFCTDRFNTKNEVVTFIVFKKL